MRPKPLVQRIQPCILPFGPAISRLSPDFALVTRPWSVWSNHKFVAVNISASYIREDMLEEHKFPDNPVRRRIAYDC